MNADHIEYIRGIVETITDAQGKPVFASSDVPRFFEIAVPSSQIEMSLPCAVLSHQDTGFTHNGSFSHISKEDDTFTKTRRLYDGEKTYQLSFYSKDIYHIIENTAQDAAFSIPFAEQTAALVAGQPFFVTRRNRGVDVEVSTLGIIDESEIIKDGIYMSYIQIRFKDGIYKDTTVPMITEVIEKGDQS